jgi:hypothetical protein
VAEFGGVEGVGEAAVAHEADACGVLLRALAQM